jgi:cephalosporin hydroxylase
MDNSIDLTLKGIEDGHFKTFYRGLKTIKCPFDYVLYQMLINEVKPDLIIEIGTAHGGSALYLADLMQNIGHGQIHTIDINEEHFLINSEELKELIDQNPRITRFLGGYENYNLDLTNSFDKIMLIDDGSHHYSDVLSVMHKFEKIISEDSYMIIEDGTVNWWGVEGLFDGGPLRAIQEFLEQNTEFEIDRKWCDFFGKNVTFNPNGYLKKKKNV